MEMKPKAELIRIVKEQNGEITVDVTGKKNGRGAYICHSFDCLAKAVKTKKLERTFGTEISAEITRSLETELKSVE
jgi:predicted RNA-binding protein YlxR (DUF448 family)